MCAENAPCTLIDRFSLLEKTLMRLGFYGAFALAAFGLALDSPLRAAIYLAASLAALNLGLLPGACAHCPYPYQHKDCLFYPYWILLRLYRYRGPNFSALDVVLVAVGFGVPMIAPQFFLWHRPVLAAVNLGLWLAAPAGMVLHFCKGCRNVGCPLNRVSPEEKERALRELHIPELTEKPKAQD